ncbi:hypothetical protein ASC87_00215 [Rhizobacter sp. Root1221]|nr:hypothetical protein ASC87_00215 [Rhizobacter sp. Root1221]
MVGARAMELTDEQHRVVRSGAGRLAVQAGAGAAKTTTLCEYAAARPSRRILYLAFNKSIQLEAQERMPANVTSRTTHSMSWRKAAELYGARAKDRMGNTYPSSIARAFGCGALTATAALQTIARWCGALEPTIGQQHVPPELAARMADPSVVIAVARDVWSAMVQGRVPDIRLPHDGYLKLFQMEQPVLRGFDTILVDEAQDLNLCTFDIVRRQSVPMVLVGDAHQCVVEGTLVARADGTVVPIERIEPGDRVRTTVGGGKFSSAVVANVFRRKRVGKLVRIRLVSGRELTSTPEHTHFAEFVEGASGRYLRSNSPHMVYLMRRGDWFRVGTTRMYSPIARKGESQYGVKVRVSQEQADCGWIVSTHPSELAARVEEAVVAANYGLPTIVFYRRTPAWTSQGAASFQTSIHEIFQRVPSHLGGDKLLHDLGFSSGAPHFLSRCKGEGRRNIAITLCGDPRESKPLHRFSVSGSDDADARAMAASGFPTRPAKRSRGWRLESSFSDFGAAEKAAEKVAEALGGALIVRKLSVGQGVTLRFMPAASVQPGMAMLNDEGELDLVQEVEVREGDCKVFDLNIERTHNFIANGIVTHNSIYGFRGSIDALQALDADERLPLTRSFRFGEGIAAVANALLSAFTPGFDQPLVGAGEPKRTRFAVDTKKGFAVIARTNACIFEEAVSFLALNRRFHFVGGTEGYKLEKILDAYYLSCGDRGLMRDPYLKSFESFEALASLAEEAEDPELKHLVRVVAEYGQRVPDLVDEIKSRHVEMDKEAWRRFDGIFLSTAHKSKGLEFDQVWLADDYMRFFEDGKEVGPDGVVQEEVHILYVALTRARAAIRLSESLEEWLRHRRLMPA